MLVWHLVVSTWDFTQSLFQHRNLCFLIFYQLTVLVLFGFDESIEFRVIHEHFLFDFSKGYEYLLLKILFLRKRVIKKFLHTIDLNKKLRILNFLMPKFQKPFANTLLYSIKSHFDFFDRFTIKINTHLNLKLLPYQKQMLLNFEH